MTNTEFAAEFQELSDAFDKNVSPQRQLVYYKKLKSISVGMFRQIVSGLITGENSFPSLARIFQAAIETKALNTDQYQYSVQTNNQPQAYECVCGSAFSVTQRDLESYDPRSIVKCPMSAYDHPETGKQMCNRKYYVSLLAQHRHDDTIYLKQVLSNN